MTTISITAGDNVASNSENALSKGPSKGTFNIGTRKSKLALVQTDMVVKALASACPDYSYAIKARDTAAGDIDKVTPFKDMPVKNIWTHELETLMIEGQLDLLVHSLKGMSVMLCSARETLILLRRANDTAT
jgi:hydroxymethylbilane synthase